MSDSPDSVRRGPVPTAWMKGLAAPVRGALLGLVLEQPGAGAELIGRLEERFGETWKLGRRDVYRQLEGLEREGLLQCREDDQQEREHAAQLIYHPTALTSTALSDWMGSACTHEPARQGIEAKLLASTEEDAPALCRSLVHYEMECLMLVQSLPPAAPDCGAPQALLRDCARDGMLSYLQAEIDWARRTRARIEEFTAAQSH